MSSAPSPHTPTSARERPRGPVPPGGSPVYGLPFLYDLAFDFRDYAAEAEVITAWHARSSGRPLHAALELAAGPARHALELARRGVEATALDLSPAMCAYAREKARELGRPLDVVTADMIDFDLGHRFDLAMLLLTSIGHVYTLDALVRHFEAVAEHLAPRGTYVVELVHPGDFLGRGARTTGVGAPWRVERGGVTLDVTWGAADDPYDPLTQLFDARVELHLREGSREQHVSERSLHRDWTLTELEAALHMSRAFELAELHGDFALDAPLTAHESWRMITVLRRR